MSTPEPHAELLEARRAIAATRGVVKSQMRSLRTCLSFVSDLDARLAELDAAFEASLAASGPEPPIGGDEPTHSP